MKTRTALALMAACAMHANAVIKIGDPLAEVEVKMENVDGAMVSIADVKGPKGTLVVFTCNHCPFVIAWQARMVGLANTYKDKGFGVIFINSNDPATKGDSLEEMKQLAKQQGYQFPYVVDATSGVARSFGATKTPDIFLFDAAGKLAYHGAVDDNSRNPDQVKETYLKDALEAVLAGQSVNVQETKAVGCSIKFR